MSLVQKTSAHRYLYALQAVIFGAAALVHDLPSIIGSAQAWIPAAIGTAQLVYEEIQNVRVQAIAGQGASIPNTIAQLKQVVGDLNALLNKQ